MKPNCWDQGVSVCTFPDIRGRYCHLKTINLLPNILGKEGAKKSGDYEALFYREKSGEKYITEGVRSLKGTALCAGSDRSEQKCGPWMARINELILAIKCPTRTLQATSL